MPQDEFAGVCLLGLDFLKMYKGVIDLVNDTLTLEINGKKVTTKLIEDSVCCLSRASFRRQSSLWIRFDAVGHGLRCVCWRARVLPQYRGFPYPTHPTFSAGMSFSTLQIWFQGRLSFSFCFRV